MKNHSTKLLSKFGNKKLKTVEAISKNLISHKTNKFSPFLWGRRGPIKMITLQGDEESQYETFVQVWQQKVKNYRSYKQKFNFT